MQVIGFNFDKISADKKKLPEGKIEIKSNINVKSITQEKVELLKDKDVVKFSFEFYVDYLPDIAKILFEGSILAIFEKEQFKDVLKKWKNKKISDEIRLPLFNLILTRCNLKALQFEEEFNLPTHVPLPRISPQPDNQGYVQ
jgi:hypothetical protein